MSDTVVVRAAAVSDAASVAATIAAAFEQYRGKLTPESGAFRETAKGIAGELRRGAGAPGGKAFRRYLARLRRVEAHVASDDLLRLP